jgi:hypothetical protein
MTDRPRVTWDGPDEELLDVKQSAHLLTVAASTLAYWAREERVPVIRLGPRATRWTRPLLRRIIAERLTDPASDSHAEGSAR